MEPQDKGNQDQEPTTPSPDPALDNKGSDDVAMPKAAFNKRLEQAKKSGVNDLLEQLGIDSADTLAAMVKAAKDKADAEKTDLQRITDERDTLTKTIEQLTAQLGDAQTTLRRERVDNSVLDALRTAKARNPHDVLTLLRADDSLKAVVGEDGTIDAKALEQAITTFKTARPDYFGVVSQGGGVPSNAHSKPPAADTKAADRARANMRRQVFR